MSWKPTVLYFLAAASLVVLSSCSGARVTPVYKPSATNVFRSECPEGKEMCYKLARDHCEGDFEVVELGKKYKGEDEITTLEFKCI